MHTNTLARRRRVARRPDSHAHSLGREPRLPRRWRVRWRRVGLVAGLLGAIVGGLLVPNLREVRRHGNEAAVIGALRLITTAQSQFREQDLDQDGLYDYGSLEELVASGALAWDADAPEERVIREGYVLSVQASPTVPEFLWMATARPLEPGVTGDRCFMVNQSGVIALATTPFQLNDACEYPPNTVTGCGCDHRADP